MTFEYFSLTWTAGHIDAQLVHGQLARALLVVDYISVESYAGGRWCC
jgi:hypothetical protein